jgi:hypothetical protein
VQLTVPDEGAPSAERARGDEHGDPVIKTIAESVAALGCRLEALVDGGGRSWSPGAPHGEDVVRALKATSSSGDGWPVELTGRAWSYAFDVGPDMGNEGRMVLVVSGTSAPRADDQRALRMLATGWRANMAFDTAVRQSKRLQNLLATADVDRATRAAFRRARLVQVRLTTPLAEGGGLWGVARALTELIGRPVVVADADGKRLAATGEDELPARAWMDLARSGQGGAGLSRSHGWMRSVTQSHGEVLGTTSVWDPEGTMSELDKFALETGADTVAIELARLRSAGGNESSGWHDLTLALVDGDHERANELADLLGCDVEAPRRAVLVVSEQAPLRDVADAVTHVARVLGLEPMVSNRDSRVVFLIDRDVSWGSLHLAISEKLGGRECRLGVGSRSSAIQELKGSVHEGELALRIGTAIGSSSVTLFDDLGIYAFLATSAQPADLGNFLRKWLSPLIAYDEQHRGDLVSTLSRWLEHGGSLERAADALYVHRSTLKYRLRRIREITGFDLSDADVRFNLQLAARALATLRALRGDDDVTTFEPATAWAPGQEASPPITRRTT